jgi:hypothetical protein
MSPQITALATINEEASITGSLSKCLIIINHLLAGENLRTTLEVWPVRESGLRPSLTLKKLMRARGFRESVNPLLAIPRVTASCLFLFSIS